MVEVTLVSGKAVKLEGHNWKVLDDGTFVHTADVSNFKTIVAPDKWEIVREYGK